MKKIVWIVTETPLALVIIPTLVLSAWIVKKVRAEMRAR